MNIELRKDLSDAFKRSYEILIFLLKNLKIRSEEDLDLAFEAIQDNTIADLSVSCKWFERVRFSEGSNGTFYTQRLISELFRFRGDNVFDLNRATIQALAALYYELSGCAQIILVYRNKTAHISANEVAPLRQCFYNSCFERVFEILFSIENVLELNDSKSEVFQKYIASNIGDDSNNAKKTEHSEIISDFGEILDDRLDIFFDLVEEVKNQQIEQNRYTETYLKNITTLIENASHDLKNNQPVNYDNKKLAQTQLTIDESERKLLQLRDKIYREVSKTRAFKPYENILQRPIIVETLKNRCTILEGFLNGNEYLIKRSRNNADLFDYQINNYGHEIESILNSTNYGQECDSYIDDHDEPDPYLWY